MDSVKIRFQDVSDTRVISLANNAQNEIAEQSHILSTTYEFTVADFADTLTYALPSNCLLVYQVKLFNSDDENVSDTYKDRLLWWVEFGTLRFRDEDDVDATALPTAITQITISYYRRPVAFSAGDYTASSSLPSEFHQGIVARIVEELYADTGNFQAAAYWAGKAREYVIRAKRYANIVNDYDDDTEGVLSA